MTAASALKPQWGKMLTVCEDANEIQMGLFAGISMKSENMESKTGMGGRESKKCNTSDDRP